MVMNRLIEERKGEEAFVSKVVTQKPKIEYYIIILVDLGAFFAIQYLD